MHKADELFGELFLTPWASQAPGMILPLNAFTHSSHYKQQWSEWVVTLSSLNFQKSRGRGSPFSRYLGFYWSKFDKQGLILKLRNSSKQNSRKLSAREYASTVKSRIFSLAKLKCYTVLNCWQKFALLLLEQLHDILGVSSLSYMKVPSTSCRLTVIGQFCMTFDFNWTFLHVFWL